MRRICGLASTVTLLGTACCSQPIVTSGSGTTTSGATGGECPSTVPVNHRPAAVMCDGGNDRPLPGSDAGNRCEQDSDCGPSDAGLYVCSCAPATRQFAGSSVNWCVLGDCRVDADCACGYCSPTYNSSCGSFFGYVGYYCHVPGDTCANDSECDGGYCAYFPQVGHWACGYGFCAG